MPRPVTVLSYDQLKEYFTGTKRGIYFKIAEEKRNDFLPHSDGVYPKDVIERQRPNEPDIVKDFRKEIWEPITKPTFSKIISSLSKIRRSSDWSIKYPSEATQLKRVADEETLEKYCEVNYPFFGSITNWVFSVLMKPYLTDSNAVIFVMPLQTKIDSNEYVKPYPFIYDCCDVLDFVPEEYAILNLPNGSKSYSGGKAFYFINTQVVQLWEQVDGRRRIDMVSEYTHGLGRLPVFKLGGIISKSDGYDFLYESRISGVLPNLNESVAEYTDLQAAKRLHVYPERWQYTQHECSSCTGTGVVKNPDYVPGGTVSAQMKCGSCNGLGYIANQGPYSMMLVKPISAGAVQPPMPPAGFIEKDVEIVKIMDESYRKHIYDALAAINFQFLDQTPLNQSGTAKEVDKDELNNTVHSIAEDIVAIMDKIYSLTAQYRYKVLYPIEEINASLPVVAVPDHFDLLSSQFMQEEIGKAKTAKLNPTIVSAMEIEFSGKRFINEPQVQQRVELILKLDPLPNVSEDEKMSMLSNKGITQIAYVISSNIQSFVQRAMYEDEDFASKDLDAQNQVMQSYAQQQIDEQKKQDEEAIKKQQEMMGGQNQPPEVREEDEEFIEEEEPALT